MLRFDSVIDARNSPMMIADCRMDLHGQSRGPSEGLVDTSLPDVVEPGGPVVVALPTSDCFSFCRDVSERKRLKNRRRMAYDLEEFLPVDADDLAIASISSRGGLLVIAADAASIAPLLSKLEASGRYVEAIAPMVLLAIAALRRQHSLKPFDYLIWQSDEGVDWIRLVRGEPVDWRWCEVSSILENLHLDDLKDIEKPKRIMLIDVDDNVRQSFEKSNDVLVIEMNREQAAESESARILSGTARPIIDLREGPLASSDPHQAISRVLKCFVALLFAFQICVAGSAFLLRSRYEEQSELLVAQQERAFRETFPNEVIPVGMVARLESEHRRLAGTRGMTGENSPQLRSAIPVAHAFLASMPDPPDSMFFIDRLEFAAAGVLNLNGTAKSYADLELFAERLRVAGLAVPPISATAADGGVSLRFDEIPHIVQTQESP